MGPGISRAHLFIFSCFNLSFLNDIIYESFYGKILIMQEDINDIEGTAEDGQSQDAVEIVEVEEFEESVAEEVEILLQQSEDIPPEIYQGRIDKDLDEIVQNQKSQLLSRDHNFVITSIQQMLMQHFRPKLKSVTEENNDLGKYLIDFCNEIFEILERYRTVEDKERSAIISRISLLSAIRDAAKKDELLSQREIKSQKARERIMQENRRAVGERPEKLSVKRNRESLAGIDSDD